MTADTRRLVTHVENANPKFLDININHRVWYELEYQKGVVAIETCISTGTVSSTDFALVQVSDLNHVSHFENLILSSTRAYYESLNLESQN